jgi:ribose 5-phosphate isomerase B
MRIAVGSDERTYLTDFVVEELQKRGHEVIKVGALATNKVEPWPIVGEEVARLVAEKKADEGVLFCWTGTGVCIAANKVPGIKAALCFDAETARGARLWDHANILVMSLRLTSPVVAKEILDSWFNTPYDPKEKPVVDLLDEIERRSGMRREVAVNP